MRAKGVDVSRWQGTIDWDLLASKIHFAFIKSTQGLGVDPYFHTNAQAAHDYPILTAPYHYYTVMTHTQDQRDNFVKAYKAYRWTLPPVVDIEKRYNVDTFSKQTFADRARDFLIQFENAAGIRPIIYSSYYALKDLMGEQAWLSEYDMWIARYPYFPQPETQWPATPLGADPEKVLFWQWTEKGDGKAYGASSNTIDLNVYKFDEVSLLKYATGKPPAPPVFEPYLAEVTASTLNVRDNPNSNAARIGAVYAGSVWVIYEKIGDWGKINPDVHAWVHTGYTKKI